MPAATDMLGQYMQADDQDGEEDDDDKHEEDQIDQGDCDMDADD